MQINECQCLENFEVIRAKLEKIIEMLHQELK